MTDDWFVKAERRATELLGDPPADAISRAMPIAVIAAIGGVIAITVVGGDADFGGAWAGIIAGAGAFLYFANEKRTHYKKRREIIERYRPKEDHLNSDEETSSAAAEVEQPAPSIDIKETTPTDVLIKACVASRTIGATTAREAAEMLAGKPLTAEQWDLHKEKWEEVWDDLLLNPKKR